MSNKVNKLQLVDVSKMNEILEYIKSSNDTDKILQGIKKQDEFELEEKKKSMKNLVKKINKNVLEKVLFNFLKKNKQLNENLTKKKKVGEVGKVLVLVSQKGKEKHPISKM